MAYTDRFPAGPILEYVERHGGIAAVLERRNYEDERYILAASRWTKATQDADTLSAAVADGLAIDLLGVHPGLIWTDWFDEDPEALDYDTIETELLLGRFDSRAEFWQYVSDLQSDEVDRNQKPRIIAAMFPEAQAYFESLPVEIYSAEAMQRSGLQIGDRCKKAGHLIKTHDDLIPRGITGMACRACQPAKLAVGMTCRNDHKIETEADLAHNGPVVYCRECRREQGRNSKARARKARQAKLTPAIAAEIRERLASGEKQAALAKEFDVSQAMVSKIKRGVNHRSSEIEGDAA